MRKRGKHRHAGAGGGGDRLDSERETCVCVVERRLHVGSRSQRRKEILVTGPDQRAHERRARAPA
jgi:hypothetical protein